MKAKFAIVLSFLSLSIAGLVYGSCGDSCASRDCGDCGTCQVGLSCCPYDNYCQCTDVGVGKNPCISRCDYCEAFGNVGGR